MHKKIVQEQNQLAWGPPGSPGGQVSTFACPQIDVPVTMHMRLKIVQWQDMHNSIEQCKPHMHRHVLYQNIWGPCASRLYSRSSRSQSPASSPASFSSIIGGSRRPRANTPYQTTCPRVISWVWTRNSVLKNVYICFIGICGLMEVRSWRSWSYTNRSDRSQSKKKRSQKLDLPQYAL